MKTIFCIVGQSASGKDTIVERVSNDMHIPKVISFTTRPKRDGEDDNKHIFINEERYNTLKGMSTFAAYTQIGQHHYFTTKLQIDTLLENNDNILYIIDPNGIKTLKEAMNNVNIVSIYINVPRSIRYQRGKDRGDDMSSFNDRSINEFGQFVTWLRRAEYDYAVKNIDIDTAVNVVESIIDAEMRINENTD